MPSRTVSRRSALKTMSFASAGVFTGLAARPSLAANDKLQIACIGTANRAGANIDGVAGQAIVALCDIDDVYLDRLTKPQGQAGNSKPARFPDVRIYHDYREMIDRDVGKIDAVVVSTADHHHVPAAIRAVRNKMHIYCEKPLSHTVHEARLITEEAAAAGVATQLGTQIHAGDNYRRVVEMIRSGAIGNVHEVHVWVGKGWGGGDRPAGSEEPPKTLHWDLWLGPAPVRPFVAGRYHPAQWRRWWDFGNGTLGDMGCHYMDLPFWALDLKYPTACEAEGPPVHPETCPLGLTVRYDFPARGDRPAVRLTWYDGSMTPKEVTGEKVPGSGVMFVGSEGKLFADYGSFRLFPEEKFARFTPPPQSIPKSIGHYAEWIKACREGTPTTCNFSYSGPLSEAVLLGNVAYRSGKRIEWNGPAMKVTNASDADALVQKAYRSGWDVS
ncbi:MAG: Gfo/Idh/MocA family oxidoreductase [Planctomycetota bacterium]|jgi:predicted dehydrogenase|nr:Gfo/Idh/MocA family oxidoreductase [Planctomycetota bacterium]